MIRRLRLVHRWSSDTTPESRQHLPQRLWLIFSSSIVISHQASSLAPHPGLCDYHLSLFGSRPRDVILVWFELSRCSQLRQQAAYNYPQYEDAWQAGSKNH
ncbi:uncharacterized protein BO95DRAFT_438516 [Aspergillus brunneoviolaceus CBS 621.78]|uniref:Uncharacterized protein n=1 Tax=Aspergillus brunneoviolaceus CBS 621.78 TaxID=1450534 RepID=A0ACD1GM18_9EURO|nr:hypothetical protein BO95DRAFT_438516 [Aspergillus brunneoviolaceus CBS 621.78]RAH50178.1 hypothetical protein BO95DRAFT_438516 [Aspergillus brunneoviolaceus CBS 621.78]